MCISSRFFAFHRINFTTSNYWIIFEYQIKTNDIMKTFKAISRNTGKEITVELGLVEKTNWVSIGGENMERKTGIFEPRGRITIPQLNKTFERDVQIYMFKGRLVFKVKTQEVDINLFVEGAHEIEDYFAKKESKRIQEEKEYNEFKRRMDL